jgi:hypothetical protein
MAFQHPSELVSSLQRPALRVRTGLWLLPSHLIGQEANEAARLGVQATDLRQELLAQLPPETQYVPLDSDRILSLLHPISERRSMGDCALNYNLDLLLARLTHQQRADFWQFAFIGFSHRPSALLFTLPATAQNLLPGVEVLERWERGERLFRSSF